MRLSRAPVLAAMIACGLSARSSAQGFQLNEIGSCAVARGLAVTGAPCKDPSNIYWNPAATTSLQGWTAYAGVTAIAVKGGFTADTTRRAYDSDAPVSFPVQAFVNYASRDGKWAAGIGAYVPYGLTSQWGGDFPGRFEALKASLSSIYFQPNVAYRFARGWSIGGGPVFGYSKVELRQSLDLAQQSAAPLVSFGALGVPAQTEFARAKLEGSGTAWGFNVGIHGDIGANWEVGARYLSSLDFHYDGGDATFRQIPTNLVLAAGNPLDLPAGTPVDGVLAPLFAPGAALGAQHVSTRIKHPAQFEAGVGYTGFVNNRLSADFEWSQFSSFGLLPIAFGSGSDEAPQSAQLASTRLVEDYRNSWSVRVGIEHAFPIGIKGRAGFDYVRTPAPDETVTPLLPDMNRRNYSVGFGVPISPRYSLDAAYLHVDTDGRRGRIVERTDPRPELLPPNTGFYTLSANVLSISIRANF